MSLYPSNINNFGIILKGKSIKKIGAVYENYPYQMIVNNFDLEYKPLKKYLIHKYTVQMTNALKTAICHKNVYRGMGIGKILASRPNHDENFRKIRYRYSRMGMDVYPFPDKSMRLSSVFGNDQKYGMTGIAAVVYVLDIIKPKHLWIVGLDFYQKDYLYRRAHQYPLSRTKSRFAGYPALFIEHIVSKNPKTMFHMVTYYKHFPKLKNLEII